MTDSTNSRGETPSNEALVSIGAASAAIGLSASRIRQLVDDGTIPEADRTSGGHRRFDLAAVRDAWARARLVRTSGPLERLAGAPPVWEESYALADTEEDQVWRDMAGVVSLGDDARSAAHYVVTEMVNNAIDHSGGTTVSLTIRLDDVGHVVIAIADDGVGLFRHLAIGLGLEGDLEALGELTKGKRTTDPDRHTGEGIFFSSKAVETFVVAANGCRLTFDNVRDDVAFGRSPVRSGTEVHFAVDPTTTRTLMDLFTRYTEDTVFNRSRPQIKLFEIGTSFVSRSEAKRLAVGLEKFSEVDLDFTGVNDVGQGFADELFRVWATGHPDVALHPIGMNDAVAFMVRRVRGAQE